ncbi:hypothetical protein Sfum_1294 [Syntrophobacter fumaroxidans MPOB]|uniref:Uncharacterized protein n=1 Tax=Syntrophobacter fumaroxidans (strain DSM 10017 / MPOB) TaxID=335543 RepID=A0LHT4_SYNFM|nr:hypothetical protein Sfum_1294 [Syntrophobacter fumaroxidans MPOB]
MNNNNRKRRAAEQGTNMPSGDKSCYTCIVKEVQHIPNGSLRHFDKSIETQWGIMATQKHNGTAGKPPHRGVDRSRAARIATQTPGPALRTGRVVGRLACTDVCTAFF